MNIYQKINAVMKDVEYVQKDTNVTGSGGGYKAVSHDQVISVARKSFVLHGIVVAPSQVKGEFLQMRDINATPNPIKMGLYSGVYEISFINTDDGNDKVTVSLESHANDNGDKATGKALTYAVKNAILKVLSLETGENDEGRNDLDFDLITNDQAQQLYEKLVDPNTQMLTNKGQKIARAYKFNHITEIKSKNFEKILKAAS